jgi:hypothetical protein
MAFCDLTGQRFGKDSLRLWLFQCDCGNEAVMSGQDAASGKHQSCGCLAVGCAPATREREEQPYPGPSVQLRPTIRRGRSLPLIRSSSFTFSSRRSVTKRRRREFSSCRSLIWLVCCRSIGMSVRSTLSASCIIGRMDVLWAFRQRWYVITLIPSDLAIALCSLP